MSGTQTNESQALLPFTPRPAASNRRGGFGNPGRGGRGHGGGKGSSSNSERRTQPKAGGRQEHLTVSQCTGANPLVQRYFEFGRGIIRSMESKGGAELDTYLLTLAKGFFYTESLLQKSNKPSGKPAQDSKTSEKKERNSPTGADVNKLTSEFARIFPVYCCPSHLYEEGRMVKTTYPDQKSKDKAIYLEHKDIVTNTSKKDQKVLLNMIRDALDDKKFLNSQRYRDVLASLKGQDHINGLLDSPLAAHKACEEAFDETCLAGRGSIAALKQYYVLKREGRLLSEAHLKSTLRVWANISATQPDNPVSSWSNDDIKSIIEVNSCTKEEFSAAMQEPSWNGAINLGRIHPRVLVLQVEEMDDPELLEAVEHAFITDGVLDDFYLPIIGFQPAFVEAQATTKTSKPKTGASEAT